MISPFIAYQTRGLNPRLHRTVVVKHVYRQLTVGPHGDNTRLRISQQPTTCPGLACLSSSQGGSCPDTPVSHPTLPQPFTSRSGARRRGANSWRCAEGAWRLPQQMNHRRLIFNSRLLLPSSISASSSCFTPSPPLSLSIHHCILQPCR